MKAIGQYRCNMCNEIILYGNIIELNSIEDAEETLTKQVRLFSYDFMPGVDDICKLPQTLLHKCNDGNIGLATLCGYRILTQSQLEEMRSEVD